MSVPIQAQTLVTLRVSIFVSSVLHLLLPPSLPFPAPVHFHSCSRSLTVVCLPSCFSAVYSALYAALSPFPGPPASSASSLTPSSGRFMSSTRRSRHQHSSYVSRAFPRPPSPVSLPPPYRRNASAGMTPDHALAARQTCSVVVPGSGSVSLCPSDGQGRRVYIKGPTPCFVARGDCDIALSVATATSALSGTQRTARNRNRHTPTCHSHPRNSLSSKRTAAWPLSTTWTSSRSRNSTGRSRSFSRRRTSTTTRRSSSRRARTKTGTSGTSTFSTRQTKSTTSSSRRPSRTTRTSSRSPWARRSTRSATACTSSTTSSTR